MHRIYRLSVVGEGSPTRREPSPRLRDCRMAGNRDLPWTYPFLQQLQGLPRSTSLPSHRMSGIMTRAAVGSAHFTCQISLTASPAKAMSERQAHSPDCVAYALNAALPVAPDSRRFSFASHGMTAAAAIKIASPRIVGLPVLVAGGSTGNRAVAVFGHTAPN